jgi:hypothetical protein
MARRFPERLRVMAEYGSSGVWVVKPFGPFRHGMIGHKKLGLPDDLARGFREWIDKYWRVLDAPAHFDAESFNLEGRRLAQALKAFVGSETDVVYSPISQDNKLEVEEQVL